MIKAAGDVAANLNVLHLVSADGNGVTVVGEDVGGLQHWVGKEAGIG